MYELFNFEQGYKKVVTTVFIWIIFMVGSGCIGYCIGLRNASRTDSGGENIGAEHVGQQIGSAVANQREVAKRIQHAESGTAEVAGSIEKSAGGIAAAAESVGRSEGLVAESNQLIGDCKSILATIRERGKSKEIAD
ncbi:MAG: hypothetical protein IJ657_09880 [Acidaminococcaceae bacterium]|nr:hypothetical protein [Acidaminococcaceae bacterium]